MINNMLQSTALFDRSYTILVIIHFCLLKEAGKALFVDKSCLVIITYQLLQYQLL